MLSAANHFGVQTNTLEKIQGAFTVLLDEGGQLAEGTEGNGDPSLLVTVLVVLFGDVVEVDLITFGVKDLDYLKR